MHVPSSQCHEDSNGTSRGFWRSRQHRGRCTPRLPRISSHSSPRSQMWSGGSPLSGEFTSDSQTLTPTGSLNIAHGATTSVRAGLESPPTTQKRAAIASREPLPQRPREQKGSRRARSEQTYIYIYIYIYCRSDSQAGYTPSQCSGGVWRRSPAYADSSSIPGDQE